MSKEIARQNEIARQTAVAKNSEQLTLPIQGSSIPIPHLTQLQVGKVSDTTNVVLERVQKVGKIVDIHFLKNVAFEKKLPISNR